ncbi:flagellar export chaperone FliS [Roseateles sp. NT4]|uniref:flagellar export chaperone FliS n=1 Tax=Roseateles sp. NT4 TaxID=3453715 RepID=UPI003EEBEF13
MYGSSSPFASRAHRSGSAYGKVGVETDVLSASPHRLVALLFDGVVEGMNLALAAIQAGNTPVKNNSLCRCVRILDEGLKAALNLESNPLAHDLRDLYAYLCMRLTYANLHSDIAAIEECKRLLLPVRDAWHAIADNPAVRPPQAA